jgi:microcystin-dependent protein
MPSIEVIEQWDDIYQLETTDPVQGGADGVDNLPHKNLANRTLWLKNNKADKNGNSVNKFQVANGTAANDAVNKSQLDSKASVVGSDIQTFKVANAIANDEAVNLGQLNTKINISDIQDILDSTNTNKPLSANQGRILKGLIDNLNTILLSDDTTLDELQEIVNFIKQNKTTLDTLAISNIAGLPDALATKAELGGSATQEYKVAAGVADDDAINKGQLDAALSNSTITGSIIAYPSQIVPSGYLECNGSLLSRTTYASLFAIIGTTYGVGDGTTTFNIPDLRGIFIRGLDNGRGLDTGRTIGSYQADEFKSHAHTIAPMWANGMARNDDSSGIYTWSRNTSSLNTNSSGGVETRPKNTAMMYCIKY